MCGMCYIVCVTSQDSMHDCMLVKEHVLEDVRLRKKENKWDLIVCLCSWYFDNSILPRNWDLLCSGLFIATLACWVWMWTRVGVWVCPRHPHFYMCTLPLFKWRGPPSGGYLPTHWRFLCAPHHHLYHPSPPPSTLACWREPCNNPPCFHDNHLLLSSPHLSLPPSLSPLPLSFSLSLPPFLPLSCLASLRTLLVFQGQRGSQSDSEIETEIWVESGERRAITMGEKTDRGRLEDKNPPDVVIVSTLDLRQLPHSTYLGLATSTFHNLILCQPWAKMADNRLLSAGAVSCCGEPYLPCCLSWKQDKSGAADQNMFVLDKAEHWTSHVKQ